MTKDEWKERCAKRYVERAGASAALARKMAEACFKHEQDASEYPFSEIEEYHPEDCADNYMSNWCYDLGTNMTTTAEKIKVMQAFEDGAQIQFIFKGEWEDCGNTPPVWAWDTNDYRIKPPAPEPLECWVNVYPSAVLQLLHESVGEAQEDAGKRAIRTAVHLREVTPQDEQDRKDAARYRKEKEISRTAWVTAVNSSASTSR